MKDNSTVVHQVRHNCTISDSHHAGMYSICGLALRLRDLYKWEKGLAPWEEKDSSEILDWIGAKEELWNDLAETSYVDLSIAGHHYDPFDTTRINAALATQGVFYGAGYAHSLKPTFFLATIEDTTVVHNCKVFILGRELARDLLTIPALSQDNCILLRADAAQLYLWDRVMYIKRSGRPALRYALNRMGLEDDSLDTLKSQLPVLAERQKDTFIYHEIGEMNDTVFEVDVWRSVIASFAHTPIELLARVVKDLLADTGDTGTLQHLIEERQDVPLALYVAFLDGLAKAMFPQLFAAFFAFMKNQNWETIARAVADGHNTAKTYAEAMVDIYQTGRRKGDLQWAEKKIREQLLARFV